jgi:tetratricopeptide (TPR) repeat protein
LLTALGELYLKLGKTRDAREKFNEAITFDKSAFMAQLRLAQVYEAEGNYQEALNSLTAASRANYGNVIILKELARLESDLGDLNEASANYQAIVSRLPSDAASHLALAKLLTLLRQYPQAAKEIQLAEAQKAYAEAISLARGRLALSQGKLAQAIALLQKSVAGERMSLEAWDLLVQAHLQNGDESSARETVGQMSKRAANIPEIDVAGGRIALNSGQVTEAINHFKRAVSLLPKNSRSPWVRAEMLVLLGRAYQENGMLKQAEEKYNEASQVCNLCAEPHYRKGLVLDERGAQEQALQSIQRAVTLNPSLMDAYYDLGQVLERDGQVAKAIEAYEKYISLDPPAELREAAAEAIRNLKN